MAKVFSNEDGFSISLSQSEFNELGLEPNKEYELVRAKPGIWVMVEKSTGEDSVVGNVSGGLEVNEIVEGSAKEDIEHVTTPGDSEVAGSGDEEYILGLVRNKSLADRVEGKFEKLLNERELRKFQGLLAQGKVIAFKLNESYKKAVYKVPEEVSGNSGNTNKGSDTGGKGVEVNTCAGEESSVTVNQNSKQELGDWKKAIAKSSCAEVVEFGDRGFMVVKNEVLARRMGEELSEGLKTGNVRGMKSFDGNFYIIDNEVYKKHAERVLDYLRSKGTADVQEISQHLELGINITKAVSEFLREDAEIVEKSRNVYKYIG